MVSLIHIADDTMISLPDGITIGELKMYVGSVMEPTLAGGDNKICPPPLEDGSAFDAAIKQGASSYMIVPPVTDDGTFAARTRLVVPPPLNIVVENN
jgi:hypothetical protein